MNAMIKEAMRYAGVPVQDPAITHKFETMLPIYQASIQPKTIWKVFPLQKQADGFRIGNTSLVLTGRTAEMMLRDCEYIVMAAATLSHSLERAHQNYSARDMEKALILDALGSAGVEEVLDQLEEIIKNQLPQWHLTDRFSCGYGDLPLSLQPQIVDQLQLNRNLGVFCSSSFMLSPSKTVTAFIGLAHNPVPARIRGCAFCALKNNCQFKKKGTTCHTR